MDPLLPEDFEEFTRYIQAKNGSAPPTLEASLAEFREYQRQFADLKAKLREAEESSALGKSKPLDIEALKRRGRERLARQSITD